MSCERIIITEKLYIHLFITQFMSKGLIIDTIGRLFVEDDFRNEFNNNSDRTLGKISGLTDKEKQFLKEKANVIRDCTDALAVTYQGGKKKRS